MYSAVLGCNVLHIPVKSIWSNVSFKATVLLLVFCLDDLPIDLRGVLNPQFLYYCQFLSFSSINICLIKVLLC